MSEQHFVQKFRHRGFQPNDGADSVEKFGNGPAPLNTDGTPMKPLWDQDHEQHSIVKKHVVVPGEDDAPATGPTPA